MPNNESFHVCRNSEFKSQDLYVISTKIHYQMGKPGVLGNQKNMTWGRWKAGPINPHLNRLPQTNFITHRSERNERMKGKSNRGHYITNRNNAQCLREILQNYHTFAACLIPPKMGPILMIPAKGLRVEPPATFKPP